MLLLLQMAWGIYILVKKRVTFLDGMECTGKAATKIGVIFVAILPIAVAAILIASLFGVSASKSDFQTDNSSLITYGTVIVMNIVAIVIYTKNKKPNAKTMAKLNASQDNQNKAA